MDNFQWISRVSILSLLTIACLAGHYFRIAWLRRVGLWLVLLGLLLSLFVVKTDSTRSRLFIWQRAADLLVTDAEAGLPFHRYRPFNPAFNHTQAAWFFQHGIAGHEAWLANDGYYAFNEALQLWYEWGWGVALLLLLWYVFFGWQLLLVWRRAAGPYHIRFWLVVALVPVVLSSLVSYPLHYWEILCYTVGITGVLLLHGQATALKVRVQAVVCVVWLLVVAAVASWWGFEALRGRKVMHEAREWWAAGDRRMAISVLTDYCSNHPAAIPHNEVLAGWHALAGRRAMAVKVLQRHHAHHCNQEMHHELGKCYAQLGQWQQAGIHFKWSLHLTPHKLGSRATLANFYQVQQQYDSARYWAQAVASMAVKVPTLQAERLKADAAAYLQQADTTIPFIFNLHHYTW